MINNFILISVIVFLLLIFILIYLKSKKKILSQKLEDNEEGQVKTHSEAIQLENLKKSTIHTKLLELFTDRYKDIEIISAGGMGCIAQATDVKTDRKVAIKTLLPKFTEDERMIKLFYNEINAIKKMNHPNIVRILEGGEQNNFYYYIMEFLEGETLNSLLLKNLPVSLENAIKIGRQVARALQHCHDNKIIHRDIKPSNIFITTKGVVKIIDFGLVKIVPPNLSNIKGTTMIGTPDFASPEQIQGRKISGKTDVFSLGVCMFHLLTNQHPFESDNVTSRIFEEPIDIRTLNQDVPEILAQTIMSCLHNNPDKRCTATKLWFKLKSITTDKKEGWK